MILSLKKVWANSITHSRSLQETIQQLELMLLLVDRKQTEPNVTLQGHKLERSRSLVKMNGPSKFLDD